jgi:Uma2 family endonuclease
MIPLDERGDVANIFKTYPDWTIEILSPDQSQTKSNRKYFALFKAWYSLRLAN